MYEQRTKSKRLCAPQQYIEQPRPWKCSKVFFASSLQRNKASKYGTGQATRAGVQKTVARNPRKTAADAITTPAKPLRTRRGMGKAPQLPKQKRLFACLPAENPL